MPERDRRRREGRESVGRKRARLHGVTRKYGAPKASRLGTKRPRRLNLRLLGGSVSYVEQHTLRLHLLLGASTSASLFATCACVSSMREPCSRLLLPPSRSPLLLSFDGPFRSRSPLRESVQEFAKGVPHTGPHRSPRYLNGQIFQFGIHHGVERNLPFCLLDPLLPLPFRPPDPPPPFIPPPR